MAHVAPQPMARPMRILPSLREQADDIDSVTAMAVQPDGRILIAGDFVTLSASSAGIARLFGSARAARLVSFSADHHTISEAGPNFTVTMQREDLCWGR